MPSKCKKMIEFTEDSLLLVIPDKVILGEAAAERAEKAVDKAKDYKAERAYSEHFKEADEMLVTAFLVVLSAAYTMYSGIYLLYRSSILGIFPLAIGLFTLYKFRDPLTAVVRLRGYGR